jgi:cytoskeletal protein CcmA (bactofilin family)
MVDRALALPRLRGPTLRQVCSPACSEGATDMGLFGRGKGDDGKIEDAPPEGDPTSTAEVPSPRVGVVSSVLAAPGDGDGPSLFDQVVERRFGPDGGTHPERRASGAWADAAPVDVDATSVDEDETDLLDDAAEPPPLEIDAMAHIGTATTIVGHLAAEEDLEIQGRIEGSVRVARHRLRIGRDAAIEASVEARIVEVEGQVVGDVVAEELVEIRSGGVVRGDVRSPRMIIDDGGILVGGLDMSAALPAGTSEDAAGASADDGHTASDAHTAGDKHIASDAHAAGDATPDRPKLIKVDPAGPADASRSEEGGA